MSGLEARAQQILEQYTEGQLMGLVASLPESADREGVEQVASGSTPLSQENVASLTNEESVIEMNPIQPVQKKLSLLTKIFQFAK